MRKLNTNVLISLAYPTYHQSINYNMSIRLKRSLTVGPSTATASNSWTEERREFPIEIHLKKLTIVILTTLPLPINSHPTSYFGCERVGNVDDHKSGSSSLKAVVAAGPNMFGFESEISH